MWGAEHTDCNSQTAMAVMHYHEVRPHFPSSRSLPAPASGPLKPCIRDRGEAAQKASASPASSSRAQSLRFHPLGQTVTLCPQEKENYDSH